MASIQRTPSGKWALRWKDPNTKKHHSKTFNRKIDARKFLHEIESTISDGSYIPAEHANVDTAAWVQQTLDVRTDLRAKTHDRTQGIISNYISPRWGGVPLADIRYMDVSQWVKELTDKGLSPRTVKKIVQTLSAALREAVKDRRIHSNPCEGVRMPKAADPEKIFLTAKQVDALADNTHDDRQRVIVYTLAYLGLRWGELAGVRVQDFDCKKRRLTIRETLVEVNGKASIGATKTGEARTVAVPKFLAVMLEEHIRNSGAEYRIFTAPRGGPLRVGNERRGWFDAAAEAIGVPGLHPHALRHTAASLAISAGASVLAVQRLLGHASAAMTLDVYASLFDDDLDEVAKHLDKLYSKK